MYIHVYVRMCLHALVLTAVESIDALGSIPRVPPRRSLPPWEVKIMAAQSIIFNQELFSHVGHTLCVYTCTCAHTYTTHCFLYTCTCVHTYTTHCVYIHVHVYIHTLHTVYTCVHTYTTQCIHACVHTVHTYITHVLSPKSHSCTVLYMEIYMHSTLAFKKVDVHVVMRDKKEGRKKQARSNKQQGKATQHTQGSHFS